MDRSEVAGRGIVCVSTNHWTGLPTSKQHLTWVLSESRRVLYVDPPIDVFSAVGRRRRWGKLKGLRRVRENVWVLSPLTLFNDSAPLARVEFHRRSASRVRRAAERLGLAAPLLWTFTPEHRPYVGELGEALSIYHVADDLPAMSSDPEAVEELERRHVEKVDLVFVVSEGLLEKLGHTGKARRLPNAADARHYARVLAGDADASIDAFVAALSAPAARPPEFAGVDGPVLLYGGATYQWFDDELFLRLAETRPDWTFAFVGPTRGRLERGGLPDNVLRVGRVDYDAFPRYVAAADVAVMPWKDDAITRNADPIMLYEYLLCGTPVVASPFPAALERGDLVRTAATDAEFVQAIEASLSEERLGGEAMARVRFGLENTWEDRARLALRYIAEASLGREGGGE